jgi:hypothetical protein
MKTGVGLNPREAAFVAHYEGAGTVEDATLKAGYKNKHQGRQLLLKPKIREAILRKQAIKLDEAAKVQGRQIGKAIKVTRNDIINRLDKLSTTAESESARIAALGHLKDIFGLSPKTDKGSDIFTGWTDDELEHYRVTGELPARFGLSAADDHATADQSATLSPDR